jgi:hypothetical protein
MLVLLMGGVMNYATEMGSRAMIYTPSFIRLVQALKQTHKQQRDLISPLSFFFSK